MDTNVIGKWAFIIGTVAAIASAFVDVALLTTLVIILGLVAGVFHPIRNELTLLGVVYLVVTGAAGSVAGLSVIGPIIADIATAWASFLGPMALTACMMWGGAYIAGKNGG